MAKEGFTNKSFIRVMTKEGSKNKGFITSHSMYWPRRHDPNNDYCSSQNTYSLQFIFYFLLLFRHKRNIFVEVEYVLISRKSMKVYKRKTLGLCKALWEKKKGKRSLHKIDNYLAEISKILIPRENSEFCGHFGVYHLVFCLPLLKRFFRNNFSKSSHFW